MSIISRLSKSDALIFLFSILIGILIFKPYPKAMVNDFGLTSEYINIARTSGQNGFYARTVTASDKASSIVVPEVKREPVGPALLMITNALFGDYHYLIYIQIAAFIIFLFIFFRFVYYLFGSHIMLLTGLLVLTSPMYNFYISSLYPYTMQVIFVGLCGIFLATGITKKSYKHFGLAGISMAIAILERSTYMLFPLFVCLVFFAFRKRFGLDKKYLGVFLATTLLVCLPWFVRNMTKGFIGINQSIGYVLGYMYGNVTTKNLSNTQDEALYNKYIIKYGSDIGTLNFMYDRTIYNKTSLQENDKLVASIAQRRILANPGEAFKRAWDSVVTFPIGLINLKVPLIPFKYPGLSMAGYYGVFAQNVLTVPLINWFILILAVIGMVWDLVKTHRPFTLFSIAVVFYVFVLGTAISLFDPRYRGAGDLLIYLYFAKLVIDMGKSKLHLN
jgi:4-amino-4-deoxy-L-arabinose transferase-like glycosyltransferase